MKGIRGNPGLKGRLLENSTDAYVLALETMPRSLKGSCGLRNLAPQACYSQMLRQQNSHFSSILPWLY